MIEHDGDPAEVVIVDDGFDMGGLAARFVPASPLDEAAARATVALFAPDGSLRTGPGPRR